MHYDVFVARGGRGTAAGLDGDDPDYNYHIVLGKSGMPAQPANAMHAGYSANESSNVNRGATAASRWQSKLKRIRD